jgi:hypothetical protein
MFLDAKTDSIVHVKLKRGSKNFGNEKKRIKKKDFCATFFFLLLHSDRNFSPSSKSLFSSFFLNGWINFFSSSKTSFKLFKSFYFFLQKFVLNYFSFLVLLLVRKAKKYTSSQAWIF